MSLTELSRTKKFLQERSPIPRPLSVLMTFEGVFFHPTIVLQVPNDLNEDPILVTIFDVHVCIFGRGKNDLPSGRLYASPSCFTMHS